MKLFHRQLPNQTLQTWVAPDFKMMKYLREILKDHQWSWEFLHFNQKTLKSPLQFLWPIIWYKMIELKFWRVLEYHETRLWSHLFIWDSHLRHLDFHTYICYELVNQFSYKHWLSYDNQYISYILLLCSIKHPQHQSPGCSPSDLLTWVHIFFFEDLWNSCPELKEFWRKTLVPPPFSRSVQSFSHFFPLKTPHRAIKFRSINCHL